MRQIYIGKTTATKYRRAIKIGISKDTDGRWDDIDRSVDGSREWPIFSGKVLSARKCEKWLHGRYSEYRVDFKGSGKTEWFRMPLYYRIECIFIAATMIIISWFTIIAFGFVLFIIVIKSASSL
jgi:hypothetical protein